MGVYKYDATNDELIPIAGAPSAQGLEDKVSTYTADATYWDTTPTAASTKPVISDGIKNQFDKANNELADVNNILGSKNILPNKATTQVINGVTFTVSADGSINVNGTATADAILHLVPNTTGKLSAFFSKGGNYIISTGTTGAGPNVFFGIMYTGSTWDIGEWLAYSTQTSKEIYIDESKLNNASSVIECYVKVNSGTTVSNKKVYPMLRPSNIKDATYVPYSKTNYELTTEISNLTEIKIPCNYGIEDIPLQRGGAMDDKLIYKRVRIFAANSGALPSFAPSGDNDMIVINHWYSDGLGDNTAIQVAYNLRADNIAFRRFINGWQPWHTII